MNARDARKQFEKDVLDVVRKELRRAMRMRAQLSILIDPWISGGGAYVHASPNTAGRSYEIAMRSERSARKRKKTS